jgi:hypothetical protein
MLTASIVQRRAYEHPYILRLKMVITFSSGLLTLVTATACMVAFTDAWAAPTVTAPPILIQRDEDNFYEDRLLGLCPWPRWHL